jgi:hypothetical protein
MKTKECAEFTMIDKVIGKEMSWIKLMGLLFLLIQVSDNLLKSVPVFAFQYSDVCMWFHPLTAFLLEFARYGYALSRHWFLLVSAMFH